MGQPILLGPPASSPAETVGAGSAGAETRPARAADEDAGGPRERNIEALVGATGWARLPGAVIARFAGAAMQAEFAGEGRF